MTNSRQALAACVAAAFAAWCGVAPAGATQPAASQSDDQIEVLARGPVHEAFAGIVSLDPQPGIVVPMAPPMDIEELPPEFRPQGANVEWIPGYWAWDDDNKDFFWVSGTWRNLPPGRQWVPGYWNRTARGFQWASGYWADAQASEIDYLPEPPESMESGPNVEATSADHTWMPGGWLWQQNRYVWRPGFWTPAHANWIWTPANYQWTPQGYIFVDGYWDHAFPRRGLLFAPVRFNQIVDPRRGFSYTPSTVIRIADLASSLFVRPNYGHYYYGDYFAANYANTGFYPAHSFHSSRRGFDPIYSHQRWHHRQDSGWEGRVRQYFQTRRDNKDMRPPRTLSAQQELLRNGEADAEQGRIFAQPLEQFRTRQDSPLQFRSLNDKDRRGFGQRGREVRGLRELRQKLESPAEAEEVVRKPRKIQLPKSTIVGRGPRERDEDPVPPTIQEFPQPDPRVTPRSRRSEVRSEDPKAERQPEATRGTSTEGRDSPQKPESKPESKPER